MLRADGLRCTVAGRTLWQRLDCAFPAGVNWVTGGEGRGKTQLLRILAGEVPAPGSRITLMGCNPQSQPAEYRQQVFWIDPCTTAWDQTNVHDFWLEQARRWPRWNADVLPTLVQAAAARPERAWIVADYVAPDGVPLAQTVHLGD